jgi:hypothetical protein
VEEVQHRATPASELSDEDDVYLAGLGKSQDLLTLSAVILGTGAGFFPNPDNLVAGLLGEGAQIPLLAGTGLIGG